MVVQNNIAAMNSHRLLSNNNNALSGNLEKLSSGYKINRAADDAAGLAISEKMRSQLKGLEAAEKNANDGISLVQTAEGALAEVHTMLNRMTYLATQSANGTYADSERAKLQDEVVALNEEIDRISQSTKFNGIDLLQNGQDLNLPEVSVDDIPDFSEAGVQSLKGIVSAGGMNIAVEVKTSIGQGTVEFISVSGSTSISATVSANGNVSIMVGSAYTGSITGTTLSDAVKDAAADKGLEDIYQDYEIILTDLDSTKDDKTIKDGTLFSTALAAAQAENQSSGLKLTGTYQSTDLKAVGNEDMNITLGTSVTSPRINVSGGVDGASITFEITDTIQIGANCEATGIQVTISDTGNIKVSIAGMSTITQDDIDKAISIAQFSAANEEVSAMLSNLEITLLTGDIDVASELKTTNGEATGTISTDKIYFGDTPTGVSTVKVAGVEDVIDDFTLNISGGVVGADVSVAFVENKDLITTTYSGSVVAKESYSPVRVTIDNDGNISIEISQTGGVSGVVTGSVLATTGSGAGKITQQDIDDAIQTEIDRLSNNGKDVEANADAIKALQNLEIGIQGGAIKWEKDSTNTNPEADGYAQTRTGLATITSGDTLIDSTELTGSKPGDIVLQVGETRDDYQQVTVEVFNMDSASLRTSDIDISYLQGAQAAIEIIENAIDAVSTVRANFGAVQNRLDHTINNLGTAQENLQAAESRIRDTDMAEEMMNYTKNNILVQSAQSMLAQANQVPQGVLQLLG